MLSLFQLGDVSLFDSLYGINNDTVQMTFDASWETPQIKDKWGQSVLMLPQGRSINTLPKLKISGTLVTTENGSAWDSFSRIKALGGQPNIPLIAFRYEDSLDIAGCNDCDIPIDWLVAYGTIIDVDNKFGWRSGTQAALQATTISFTCTVTLYSAWTALSPWFWELRSTGDQPINASLIEKPSSLSDNFTHPQSFRDIRHKTYFFRWNSPDSVVYNPMLWAAMSDRKTALGSNWRTPHTIVIYPDPRRWTLSPAAMYAFRGLSPTDTLTIRVETTPNASYQQALVEESVLDLAQLNTDLENAGLYGLRESDVIYTGDVRYSGYIVRDGVTLPLIRPKWSYPHVYPGSLNVGYTQLSFIGRGQAAFYVKYRTI